jgi:lipoprotein signal peptidase
MKWLKSLLSKDEDVSSKRVSAILALLVCISLAYVGTFTTYRCPDYMFQGLLLIAGGGLGLTVVENIFDRIKKKDDTPSEQ